MLTFAEHVSSWIKTVMKHEEACIVDERNKKSKSAFTNHVDRNTSLGIASPYVCVNVRENHWGMSQDLSLSGSVRQR